MSSEFVTFSTHDGRSALHPGRPLHLTGYLWRPTGKGPFPAIVYNHGSEQDPGDKASLGSYFSGQGYAFFVVHRRGHGQSPGTWVVSLPQSQRLAELESQVDDVVAGLDFLARLVDGGDPAAPVPPLDIDTHRIAVMGGSYGGVESVLTAERDLWHVEDAHPVHARLTPGIRAAVDFGGAAESWGQQDFQDRLVKAVRAATVPTFFLQAQNDYDIQPSKTLAEEMAKSGLPHQMMIFPVHYRSTDPRVPGSDEDHQQGHGGFMGSPSEWGPWVVGFLEPNLDTTVSEIRVSPEETDSSITDFLADHHVLRDSTVPPLGTLFVFLPGSGGAPRGHRILLTEAARAGYHVVGLTYPNPTDISTLCDGQPANCIEQVHQVVIGGGTAQNSQPPLVVPSQSSVLNRLVKLLQYLHQNRPSEGWGDFLDGDQPAWARITLCGHSLGGATVGYMAKMLFPVNRVIMLSSPGGGQGTTPEPWVHSATMVTPAERYFGLFHTVDHRSARITNALAALGLGGPVVKIDDLEWPFKSSHALFTEVPTGVSAPKADGAAHNSPAADGFTPLMADGSPVYRKVWRYMFKG